MKKSILLGILGLVIVVGLIAAVKGAQIAALIKMGETFSEPPLSISSFEVKSDQWESTLSAIGSLEAAKGLLITADLSGRISKIHFNAGAEVKAGDLLVQQDISTERAQLRSAQAAASLAKSNLDRISELYTKKVASKSELDNAKSSYQSAIADVDNIRATIEKKSIKAPFDGRLGIRLVNLGQTINAGESLVSLQATNQMFVNFFLPQQMLPTIAVGLPVRLTSDAVPEKVFTGKINAIDPEIDTATRSIKLQAIMANPEKELLPGMFASLNVVLPKAQSVLLVPITAIQYATYGDSVFVIEDAPSKKEAGENDEPKSLVSRQQFVKLGEQRGDFVTVTKGLEEGQLVASAGVFKLRNNAPVVINNDVVPDFSVNPLVDDK
ncbi:MAG: efflux RND transporter periplasmic adaptor subunit [Cellvibrionaceae bacterium]